MSHIVIRGDGVPCPRCSRATQIREHSHIRPKQLNQPYYYKRWFYCTFDGCATTTVMRGEDIVWNNNPRGQLLRRLSGVHDQLKRRA